MPEQVAVKSKELHKSKIGGQALIGGIMMRGVYNTAMAVRTQDKEIDVEIWDNNKGSSRVPKSLKRFPFVRGIFNMIDSMLVGYKCIMKSAEMSGMDLEEEEEPSKFDLWLERKLGDNLMKVVTWIGAILGVILAVALFSFLPTLAVWGLEKLVPVGGFKALIEGVLKIGIFVLYLALVGKMSEMKLMYQYHGAEHKTIACFEAGEELTVENIKKQTRFHPRCGTSFMILVLIISILVTSIVTLSNPFLRTAVKLALLPVIIGIAYELIKIAGRYDNLATRIISYPGLKLQHLTTKEPEADQIEVAIKAMEPVIPENLEDDRW